MNHIDLKTLGNWGKTGSQEALRQVAEICQKALSLPLVVSPDGSSFLSKSGEKKPPEGILSAAGKVEEDSVIVLRLELVRGPDTIRVPPVSFFKHLSSLGDKVCLLPPQEEEGGKVSLWVELKGKAQPMSVARASAFLEQIKQLDALARTLQAELPAEKTGADLIKLYKEFAEFLEPVHPLPGDELRSAPDLVGWAQETVDFLTGSSSVAVASPFSVTGDFALAALARVFTESGDSVGLLTLPAINSKGLLELARKAPGAVAVPAVRLSLGTSPYDLGNEMQSLLSALSTASRPAIFTGTVEQLQGIFSGGQGAVIDPLLPIVCHVPDIPIEPLCRFAIRSAGKLAGGLTKRTEAELAEKTLEILKDTSPAEQKRILPVVAKRTVHVWSRGKKGTNSPAGAFVSKVSGLSETLGGLSSRPRVKRRPDVQERFTKVLSDPALVTHLKEHLLAQDHALEQLVSRLAMETLTRPLHQPIRYCAQGTPATGKSESAVLLARRLGIPYVNIDAASMPDYHTAASQLLGSGRGIVMSYQAGRLEQVAKHHTGVLVELSDLDHAVPSVRGVLADLFLQVLETGEAQSATGAMFSCTNVIFAFTMNLPGGMDEGVRKGIGFTNAPTRQDVNKRVVSEIKMMLSSAFVSRIGTPILFEPLDGEALDAIVELAVRKAIVSAAERLHAPVRDIELEKGLGSRVIATLEASVSSFGARALLEHGRSVAATAFVELHQRGVEIKGKTLHVSAAFGGKLVIHTG